MSRQASCRASPPLSLSALQDETIAILYELAVRDFYPAFNPTASERLAIVATGGYGRGQLAPGSDIDLLFVRPFKQTAWGESVIEFILYMLWDLGLKVGHATRSLGECVRLAKQDITIRTAMLEARYLWGDAQLYDELRKKFWSEVATGNGQDFVEAKLAERDERHARQGESRYLVEPNIKEGKGGLRDLQTLYWIGKYLYHVDDAADLVEHNVFTTDEYKTFQKAEAFLWDVRVHLHYLVGRAEERLSFDVQPELAAALGFTTTTIRAARSKPSCSAYFLVAKDVGDLTRIFCAALEEQNRKRRPIAAAHAAGLPQAAHRRRRFLCRERPAERARRHLPQRSGQSDPHLPYRRRQERRRASRRAAHDHALARSDHRRRAPRSGSQPPVSGDSVVAPRSGARAAADERGRRVRAASCRNSAVSSG